MKTNRLYIILILLLPGTFLQAQPNVASDTQKQADSPTINVTKLNINDKILEVDFEIINNLKNEVWICDQIECNSIPFNSEICIAEDNQLLTIRRRLDVPSPGRVWARQPYGKYIRLLPGKKRYESLSVNVPIDGDYIFKPKITSQVPENLFYVSRLAIEIGYYKGNLPEMIFNMLEEAENIYNNNTESKPQIMKIFGDALTFNYFREQFRDRDEEILIPYTYQRFKGEKVLRTVINELRIPCKKRPESTIEEIQGRKRADFAPDLKTCTKLEIRYEPSSIEYFFPFAINQSLLSREEIEYLQSEQTFVIENQNVIKSFAKKIINGGPFYGIVRENNIVHLDCYHNNEPLTSLTIYGNRIVETNGKKRLGYYTDFLSNGILTPEIQNLMYRVQCSVNLRDLYYRLRFYNLIVSKQKKELALKDVVIYPKSIDWFDAITSSGLFPGSLIREILTSPRLKKPHICPCVGKGESTYAMNPNCGPNSPGDMVLLFETKAGWNQSGGPELFTFDNHDPKGKAPVVLSHRDSGGGCVLLNDGTVKFIRTEAELNQLRWK